VNESSYKYIHRKFKNIEFNNIENFDEIIKIHVTIHHSTISIILGEPASGKTYQLKSFAKNNANTYFVELINVEQESEIPSDTKVVLLDSIDEALDDYENPKKLQIQVRNLIYKCREINSKMNFVISCRFVEWNEYFKDELQKLDKELRIYTIVPLSEDDINKILSSKNINRDEFWNFINRNYLEFSLKNIMIINYLIENFTVYKNQKVKFIDIYQDIIKEHLTIKGSDREEISNLVLINELLLSSSLATYMLLNREKKILPSNTMKLADELYKINSKDIITSENLKSVLKTALFEKKGDSLSFFHKSIQEYLVAYFINHKQLNVDTIKKIFSHELRFYEEFEEVIIYLTNIQPALFNEFVEFDPFIFKRHPNLSTEEQEKLLVSILNKLKNDKSLAWGKFKYFKNSTLVNYPKLTNLTSILKQKIDIEHIDNIIFPYILMILENNYTQELEDYIFNILNKLLSDTKKLKKLIKNNFVDEYRFNKRLFHFMQDNNLFEKDLNRRLTFELNLFESLYGIKYVNRWGDKKKCTKVTTDFNFGNLIYLLEYIPLQEIQYVVPCLEPKDILLWFEWLKINFSIDKHAQGYSSWLIYALLKKCTGKEVIFKIFDFLNTHSIYLTDIDNIAKLHFNDLTDDFWKLYFKNKDLKHNSPSFFYLFDFDKKDINELSKKYPIENYVEKYAVFRRVKDADDVLMQNQEFKNYMEELWAAQKNQQKKYSQDTKKQKQICKKSIEFFNTDNEEDIDFYNIFDCALLELNGSTNQELDTKLRETLQEKYPIFIDRIKQEFKNDKTYRKLKKELTSSSAIFMFEYLFKILSSKEIDAVVQTKKDFIKLFWLDKSIDNFSEYFIKYSLVYFDCFVYLTIHSIKLSLKRDGDLNIIGLSNLIQVYKKIEKFDLNSLQKLILYIKTLSTNILKNIEISQLKHLVEILSLDKNNFDFLKDKIIPIDEKSYVFLEGLLKINTKKAIKYFIEDIFNLSGDKKEKFLLLMTALTNDVRGNYENYIDKMDSDELNFILSEYYNLIEEYVEPEGSNRIYINYKMFNFIDSIWKYLDNTSNYIELLEKLSTSENQRLSEYATYSLEREYNQQLKDRNVPNSYYKDIFDKEEEVKKANETHIHGNVYGAVNNHGEINQLVNNEVTKDKEKWYSQWWFISLIIGVVGGGLTWWQFNLWVGVVIFFVLFLIMIMFNPKRRFFRIGLSSLFLGGLQFLPYKFDLIIPKNDFIYGYIKSGDTPIPWFGILLILLSIFLFWLDSKNN